MTPDKQLEALWAVLHAPNYFMVTVDNDVRYLPVGDLRRFQRTLGGAATLGSPCSVAAVPRLFEDRIAVGHSTVLWARTKSKAEIRRLYSFRPVPTMMLQDGETVRYTALWALTDELPYDWTNRLNRRIAHALGTTKHYADPTHFTLTPPGCIGEGDKVSRIIHMEPHFYGAKEIAGRLADAPDPRAAYKRHLERQAA